MVTLVRLRNTLPFLTEQAMAESSTCLGHKEREDRKNIIGKLATRPKETPDENLRVWIKKGPVSVKTSLKELEENYEGSLSGR